MPCAVELLPAAGSSVLWLCELCEGPWRISSNVLKEMVSTSCSCFFENTLSPDLPLKAALVLSFCSVPAHICGSQSRFWRHNDFIC